MTLCYSTLQYSTVHYITFMYTHTATQESSREQPPVPEERRLFATPRPSHTQHLQTPVPKSYTRHRLQQPGPYQPQGRRGHASASLVSLDC